MNNIWEIDKVLLFLVLVLPGFVSIKVYSNLIASDKIDFSKSIIEAICFSALNFGVLAFPISYISGSGYVDSSPIINKVVVKSSGIYFIHSGAESFLIPKRCFLTAENWRGFKDSFLSKWDAGKKSDGAPE